eukprot:Em0005g746a
MLQTFTMMSSTEASSASSASTAGSSGSDPAIAELVRGMHQMQEEHRVVCQRLGLLQAHRDNNMFKKKGNECQYKAYVQVADRLAVVSSCLDHIEAANAVGREQLEHASQERDRIRIEKAKKAAERKVAKRRRLQEEKQMEGGARKDVTRLSSEPALEPKITFVATKDGSSGVPRPRFSVDSCFRCGDPGHFQRECSKMHGRPEWSQVGSGKPHLQVEALKVFKTCTRYNIRLEPEWVPRKMNQLSDYCSHVVDYDDWYVDPTVFAMVEEWNRGSGHVHSELVWGNQLVVSTTYYHSKGDQACSMWLCPKGEEWAPFVVDYRILPLSEELIKPATVLRSRADSTTKKYLGAFQQWKFWADTRQGVPSFPVQEIQLVLYMQHLIKPTLEGLKRMLAKPKVRKEPVTADMLKAMVEATGSEPPLSKDRLVFALALCSALRSALHDIAEDAWHKVFMLPKCLLLAPKRRPVPISYLCAQWSKDFDIMALLHSFPKDTACGPSGLRIQHLIEAAEVPLQFPICAVLRDWSTYLSLARFLYKWLGSSQGLGVTCPAGAEKIIHGLRGCVDEHWHDADFAILKIDLHNAFNRSQQLQRMLTVHPYKWYIDDGVVAGPIAAIAHVLAIIQDRGPPLGLYINIAKCELFRVSDLSTFPDEIKRSNVFPPIEILGVPIGDLVFCATFVAQKQSEASKLLQHLEAVGSIDHQKVLSSKIEDRQFGNLFHSATLTDKARLLSISSPPTSAWLSVTPSPRLNLHLEPAEFQVALKWWLGIPVVQGQSCPQCPSFVLDDFGHHSLSYFLVPNWDLGKPAAFDLSIMSTLHPSVLQEASMTAGSAALVAENRKHKYNDRKCEELGWVCIPLVVKTYGCWGAAAVAAFSKLAGCLSIRLNQPKSKIIYGIYSCLGLALVRANCRAILSRLT